MKIESKHRCKTCGAEWEKLDDGSFHLPPGQPLNPCCDNVPMELEPIPDKEPKEGK